MCMRFVGYYTGQYTTLLITPYFNKDHDINDTSIIFYINIL